MKFEEVLPALREGKKIKRRVWRYNSVVWKDHKLTGRCVGWLLQRDLDRVCKDRSRTPGERVGPISCLSY